VTSPHAPAPQPSYRLIPSRFPPIPLFETVASADDLPAVMELAGWTNDRLTPERLARLPPEDRVHGRPNASVVLAAFLHVSPTGSRFNGPDLGAWYAAADLRTAIAEVGHHLRREAVASRRRELRRTYRAYSARLAGDYLDIRGQTATRPDLYAADNYAASQAFGEAARKAGEDGILFASVRLQGGENVVAYRPRHVLDVVQADHFEIVVRSTGRLIDARRLRVEA
jgi:hypothetical protein